MTRKQWLLSSVVAFTTLVSTAVIAGPIENYSPVTSARLENPEPENWLMARGSYKGWSYSSLDQINTSNVKDLKVAWTFSTGLDRGHEAAPLVVGSTMYIVTPWPNLLYALDLTKPGSPLKWQYNPRRTALALQAKASRRVQRLAQYQPRRGPVRRQGLYGRTRWRAGRARRQDRQGRLEREGRGLEDRLLYDRGAPGGERQDSGRRGGGRVRRARLRPGIRSRVRQLSVEDLHGSGTRRAGKRHLAEARHLEDRRSLHLDEWQL